MTASPLLTKILVTVPGIGAVTTSPSPLAAAGVAGAGVGAAGAGAGVSAAGVGAAAGAGVGAAAVTADSAPDAKLVLKHLYVENPEAKRVGLIASAIAAGDGDAQYAVKSIKKKVD